MIGKPIFLHLSILASKRRMTNESNKIPASLIVFEINALLVRRSAVRRSAVRRSDVCMHHNTETCSNSHHKVV